MIADIGHGASVAELARSIQALGDLLKTTNEQSTRFAEKLLTMQVQEKIRDASLGSKIDTEA